METAKHPAPQSTDAEPAVGMTVPEWGWHNADPLHAMAYIMPALQSLLPPLGPQVRVLDVGCGNGFLAGWFSKQGCRVVGVDLSAAGIAQARQTHPEARFELLGADADVLERLNEPPFDIVVSTEVVEHLYSPGEWATGCYSALRPGGQFFCSTPYHGYLKNLALSVLNKWDRHANPLKDGGHIKFWSRPTLSKLLTDAGFKNIRFAGAGRAPYLWMSMVMSAEKPK